MKCASSNCSFADLTTTDPCVVCGQGAHHICSNELSDAGSLSERFCSASCLYQWKTVTPPPSMSDLASDDSSSQSSAPSDSQASLVPLAQSVEGVSATPIVDLTLDSPPPTDLPPSRTPEIPSASPSTVASSTLSPTAPRPSSSVGVDAFGVPLAIRHHRQDRGRHDVWELAHQLDEPYVSSENNEAATFTHVCLLCAQELTCNAPLRGKVPCIADENKSKDVFTPLMLVRRNGVVCWRVEAVYEHVDILRWFRESACGRFRSIAALARIWLRRAPSNASQERVFLDGRVRDEQLSYEDG
ncbi:hypothetical protein PR003_g19834 [Phytophthora rubi]|uniref:Uncharacterized protein n=1 Tax=Phytophthora rubi TaxID=129364 RepID=A0A6A4DPM7_9STRA|nr:hypothetical protein PR001_g18706 [Phytophthora rubi]KAE9312171.1 hypothetical protein PR003_g19834 [Phytophthora rubi]